MGYVISISPPAHRGADLPWQGGSSIRNADYSVCMQPMRASSARWRLRTLADAGLAGPPVLVYKSDQRSRVWRVQGPGGSYVVKQFIHTPLKQRLTMMVRRHPAQCEMRMNCRLCHAGVAVIPIDDAGVERVGLGVHVWLATPLAGMSLQRRLGAQVLDPEEAERWIDAAAQLTEDLNAAGFWFKDLKPSNILIDDDGRGRLIDVGSARRLTDPSQVLRMLAVMDRVLARDGVGDDLRRRFRSRLSKSWAAVADRTPPTR